MTPTRREFIKNVGIAMASLVMARCVPSRGGDDSPERECGSARDCLRQCWLRLDWLAVQIRQDYERGAQARDGLITQHRADLDDLVAAGELDAAVAEYVQAAYAEAVGHVWLLNGNVMCYESVPLYTPDSADRLMQQAKLLAGLAESGDFDSDAVARAQAAIERDIAFLSLSSEETQALYDELIAAAGDSYEFPSFDELDLDIPLEAAAAARFLADLLLGEAE
jgi:hypothetical protein